MSNALKIVTSYTQICKSDILQLVLPCGKVSGTTCFILVFPNADIRHNANPLCERSTCIPRGTSHDNRCLLMIHVSTVLRASHYQIAVLIQGGGVYVP